jgi:hypothetical protein
METECVLCEVQIEFNVFLYEVIFKITDKSVHQVIISHYSSVLIVIMLLSEGRVSKA